MAKGKAAPAALEGPRPSGPGLWNPRSLVIMEGWGAVNRPPRNRQNRRKPAAQSYRAFGSRIHGSQLHGCIAECIATGDRKRCLFFCA